MTKLIISSDDLGLSRAVNRGIVQAYRDGLTTSVSLMACGQAFEDAVDLIQANKIENVGLHLVLDQETPLLPADAIPTLVTNEGRFHSRAALLSKLLFTRHIDPGEVKRELRAQFQRCFDHGLPISHVDGHGHVHVFPHITPIVVELCKEFSIRSVRLPLEPFRFVASQFSLMKHLRKLVISFLARAARRQYDRTGFAMPDVFYGTSYGGRLSTEKLKELIGRIPFGASAEIMSHPGHFDRRDMGRYVAWGYDWETELDALLCSTKADIERSMGLKLISFKEL